MIAAGIDPGTDHSGLVVYDTDKKKVIHSSEMINADLILALRGNRFHVDAYAWDLLFIEKIEAMGLIVGKSTFETCIWIGRFMEAYSITMRKNPVLVSRGDEKITLCGAATFKNPETGKRKSVGDSQIRAALIERFPATGGGVCPQVGTQKQPGPLYGVSGHCWQALSVVITGLEIQNSVSTVKEKKVKPVVIENNDLGF
jgi:hypothetical protein